MSKARVAVLKVISKELSVTAAAEKYGYSRQHLHRLLARYRSGGLDAVGPRSRAPRSSPQATSQEVRDLIVGLRRQLTDAGWDAGPVTIAWHLEQSGHTPPSTSTIRRILHAAGLVTPQPHKRPRSSWHRFEASQPNECWQSDYIHWRLADDTEVEIIDWIDDCSRFLLGLTAVRRVTGDTVVDTFINAGNEHGFPASTLTDNGMVYTTRLSGGTGGKNGFEYLLGGLGITQKNGRVNHPQTQGKSERFHQTEQRWLAARPPAETVTELQALLDQFRHDYNTTRPHRALGRATPAQVYDSLPKDRPAGATTDHFRLRHDRVDPGGKISLRRAGRMHHLGIGRAHHGKRVLAIADQTTVTVIELRTGEILSQHDIDPTRSYWRNTQRAPGHRPGAL